MRILKVVAGGLVLLLVAGWFLFPTDELVRAALAHVPLPPGMAIVFRSANLRPWGLRLDEPAVRRSDGTAVVAFDWIRAQPSWGSLLWTDHTGRPWHVTVAACGGTADADVDFDTSGKRPGTLHLVLADVDLGHCPPLATVAPGANGVVGSTADVRLLPGGGFDGRGDLQLRATRLEVSRLVPGAVDLDVEQGRTRWTYGADRLVLEDVDVKAAQAAVRGGGTLQLKSDVGASGVDFRLVLRLFEPTPPQLRQIFESLPPAPGEPDARLLAVRGTLHDPRVVRNDR